MICVSCIIQDLCPFLYCVPLFSFLKQFIFALSALKILAFAQFLFAFYIIFQNERFTNEENLVGKNASLPMCTPSPHPGPSTCYYISNSSTSHHLTSTNLLQASRLVWLPFQPSSNTFSTFQSDQRLLLHLENHLQPPKRKRNYII